MGINLKDYLGDFLNESTLENKEYTIIDIVEKYSNKYEKNQLVLTLDAGLKPLQFFLNKTNLKKLIDYFGDDTDKWILKRIKFKIVEIEIKGKYKKSLRVI